MTIKSDLASGTTNDFTALLDELGAVADTMAKALASGDKDDKKIKKAAGENADQGDDSGAGDGGGDGEGDGEPFGKSFEVTLEDGTKVSAFDGTAMMKALHEENLRLHVDTQALGATLKEIGEKVVGVVKQQGEMIKSLQTEVAGLRDKGAGRRAVISVHDKPGPTAGGGAKAEAKAADVLQKAEALAKEGKMTFSDVARIEAHQLHGVIAPPDLLKAFPTLLG